MTLPTPQHPNVPTYSDVINVEAVVLLGSGDPLDNVAGSHIGVLVGVTTAFTHPGGESPGQAIQLNVRVSLHTGIKGTQALVVELQY